MTCGVSKNAEEVPNFVVSHFYIYNTKMLILSIPNIHIAVDTVCPLGWDLFDDYCVKISDERTSLVDNDVDVCQTGSYWYNNSLAPYWFKV